MVLTNQFLHDVLMQLLIWYIIIPLSLSALFAFLTLLFLALKRRVSSHEVGNELKEQPKNDKK